MAASELMRVSSTSAERVRQRATTNDRTIVAELDRIIEAGIAALDKPAATRKRKATAGQR